MKTAVSIPDDVFAEAEDMVRRLKISRSELYASALREYLSRHDADRVTAALDQVYADVECEPDPAVLAAGRQTLLRDGW